MDGYDEVFEHFIVRLLEGRDHLQDEIGTACAALDDGCEDPVRVDPPLHVVRRREWPVMITRSVGNLSNRPCMIMLPT